MIVALDYYKGIFEGVLEEENGYQFFVCYPDRFEKGPHFKKSDYRDYEHFVDVMSKFMPDTLFFKKGGLK